MLVGYARISTEDQNLDLQKDALQRAGCGRLFTDVASGAKDERVGLAEAEFKASYEPVVDDLPVSSSRGTLVPKIDALPDTTDVEEWKAHEGSDEESRGTRSTQ